MVTISTLCFSQAKILVNEAYKHEGEKITVCAKVCGVTVSALVTFIYTGAAYPDAPLTILIFNNDRKNFNNIETTYSGKFICVTGIIKEYKGKAEMIIRKPEDISISSPQ